MVKAEAVFGIPMRIGIDILKGDGGNDNLFGGNSNDRLFGGDGNDILEGQNNNDRLYGGNGIDRLEGGNGIDTLTGGSGEDNFVFANTTQGMDFITDFTVTDDILSLTATGFAGITATSIVSTQMFTIGANATSNSHRFIYSASSGDLFYDSDGIGSNSQIKLAQLDSGLALTNNNFQIIS